MSVKKRKKKINKSKDFDISKIVSDLAEKFEIEVMSEDSPDRTPYYIKFRHKGLQMITGGVPGGRMIEIRGDSQSGKSYLLYELGIETIKMGGAFLLHDIETAYEPAYGIRVGLEGNRKFALSEEKKMENIFALSRQFVLRVRKKNKTCPILIGADSYPPIQTNLSIKEIEQHAKDGAKALKGYREAKKNALFSNLIGEFITFMRETDTTFVLLNQLKKQIGVIFGDDKTSNADNIIKYYVTLRLQGEVGKKIRNPNKTINGVKKMGKQIGVVSHWKTIKNRKLSPHKTVSTRILYKTGVDRLSGLQDLLVTEDIVSRIKGKPKLIGYGGKQLTIEALMKKKPSLFRELSE